MLGRGWRPLFSIGKIKLVLRIAWAKEVSLSVQVEPVETLRQTQAERSKFHWAVSIFDDPPALKFMIRFWSVPTPRPGIRG